MGYKSVIRSAVSASNQISREAERAKKQQAREAERKQKKIAAVEEKMQKICQALEDLYAKGKIDKEKYNELAERKNDIGLDFIIIGKTPAVSLSKRYITGQINKDEFESIKNDLLPSDLIEEKNKIKSETDNAIKKLEEFYKNIKGKANGNCQNCGKKKGFLSPIKNVDGFELCGGYKSELSNLKNYKGFNGSYYTVQPATISQDDIKNGFKVEVKFNHDLL